MSGIKTKSEQLKEVLAEAILKRKYLPHQRIPSEQKLMDEYALSRVTVRRAILALAEEGVLSRNSGRGGTVVTEQAWAILKRKQGPALKKTTAVGLVLHPRWMRDSIIERYFKLLIKEMEKEVVFKVFFHDYLNPAKYLARGCQLLIIPQGYPQDEIAACEKNLPVIAFSPPRAGNYIFSDNIDGGKKMLKYLAAKGHKRIITFAGGFTENRLHFEGVAAMAAELNLDLLPIELTSSDFEQIRTGIEKLLAWRNDFSAIIAPTDRDAIKICGLLENAGLKVPDQVSVMGADDMFYAEYYEIPLTTLQHPFEGIAAAFAAAIRGFIASGKASVQTLVPENIVERESVKTFSPAGS